MTRHRVLGALVGTYLLALGFLGGVATERMRFDAARAAVLEHFETAATSLRLRLMTLEREGVEPVFTAP